MQQAEHELVPMWNVSTTGEGLAYYTTALVPNMFIFLL